MDDSTLARYIDHTLLAPDATPDQIARLCHQARRFRFAAVCVNPTWVPLCARLLEESAVKVCTVAGFPLGASFSEVKILECRLAIARGAGEIDMAINIGALKARELDRVAGEIRDASEVAHGAGAIVKVIIETALLTDEEKKVACLLAREAGADFVKTSTGFAARGATVEDVALMRSLVGPVMGVKAAGGIRTREQALSMIRAGATRLGTSSAVAMISAEAPPTPEARTC